MEKGVDVRDLIQSKVFCFTFDYDEWHSTSTDPATYMRPYNGSFFELRSNFKTVFPEERFQVDYESVSSFESAKLYKVNYRINFLPILGQYAVRDADGSITLQNEGDDLLDMMVESG